MNTASLALVLHLVSAVLWVGGMFFAYQILRPVAAGQLSQPMWQLHYNLGSWTHFQRWLLLPSDRLLRAALWLLLRRGERLRGHRPSEPFTSARF